MKKATLKEYLNQAVTLDPEALDRYYQMRDEMELLYDLPAADHVKGQPTRRTLLATMIAATMMDDAGEVANQLDDALQKSAKDNSMPPLQPLIDAQKMLVSLRKDKHAEHRKQARNLSLNEDESVYNQYAREQLRLLTGSLSTHHREHYADRIVSENDLADFSRACKPGYMSDEGFREVFEAFVTMKREDGMLAPGEHNPLTLSLLTTAETVMMDECRNQPLDQSHKMTLESERDQSLTDLSLNRGALDVLETAAELSGRKLPSSRPSFRRDGRDEFS